jgi:hypothetical protein
MEHDTNDLIAPLCTRIGMIMEDTSVAALTLGGLKRDERPAAIAEVEIAAQRIDGVVAVTMAWSRATSGDGFNCSTQHHSKFYHRAF